MFENRIKYMQEALKEAQKAYKINEVPVGAIIVQNNKIISRAHNRKEKQQDSTFHAEILAIQKASRKISQWRLSDCELYVTLEPCSMCAGAIIQARIDKVFIGTKDPKAGAVGSIVNLFDIKKFNHIVEYEYGLLALECSDILKKFFKELRSKKA